MSDLWAKFREGNDQLRGHIFTARFMLAIVICPIIGIVLFATEVKEKGFGRLTFGDIYPAISISLAGIVYFSLHRFLTRPFKFEKGSINRKTQDAMEGMPTTGAAPTSTLE